jgi:serine protease Do
MFRERSNQILRRPILPAILLMVVLGDFAHCSQSQESNDPADHNPPAPSPAAVAAVPTAVGSASLPSNDTFVTVAKIAKASVVNISSTRKAPPESSSNPLFEDPFFRRFFGEEFERRFPAPRERREQGLGSGVIATADGYIVTNNHVVEQADEIKVLLGDKRSFKAKLIGTDPKTDVAVIKIEASNLPTLPWGDSSTLQVGEMILAVGNPFGLNQTVTMGIISAVGRANMGIVDYEDFIQTDAAINPGNSGGALVNLKGELIGINTAIFTRSGGYMGIGFAIPSNMVKTVMTSLVKQGKVVRGWIGVSIQELNQDLAKQFGAPDTKGALVGDVMDDSPASKAKLERGDIITRYNDVPVNDPSHLRMLVAETAPGTAITLKVLREKQTKEVKVTIGELPKELARPTRGGSESGKGGQALTGVTVQPLTADRPGRSGRKDAGVVVTEVQPDTAAERAGLRPGDVIREINRKAVRSVQDFERMTGELSSKATVLVLLTRGNATIFLSITPD